ALWNEIFKIYRMDSGFLARKMRTLLPSASDAGLVLSEWTPGFPGPAAWVLQDLKVQGDLALARVTARFGEDTVENMIPLKRINDRWFVTLPPHFLPEAK
ncbi:MAG: hypothetical protein ACYS0K_04305, partial [Planctomycetota bacterium]